MTNPSHAYLTSLAEALFRFSAGIDQSLASHVQAAAVGIAGSIADSDEHAVERALARAAGVINLGRKVGAIAESDADVISAAIDRSRAAALPKPANLPSAPSVAEFSKIALTGEKGDEVTKVAAPAMPVAELVPPAPAREVVVAVSAVARPDAVVAREAVASVFTSSGISAENRQDRIVAAIRQNPMARMRDLLAALPGVSERTIRYDIERLVTSGKIEREGVGGPATRYRIREGVTTR